MEEIHRGIWIKLFKHKIVACYGYDTTSSYGEALISTMMAYINGSLEFTLSWGKDSNEWMKLVSVKKNEKGSYCLSSCRWEDPEIVDFCNLISRHRPSSDSGIVDTVFSNSQSLEWHQNKYCICDTLLLYNKLRQTANIS